VIRACEWGGVGAENGAERFKNRVRSGEWACEKTMEWEQSVEREGHGAGTEW